MLWLCHKCRKEVSGCSLDNVVSKCFDCGTIELCTAREEAIIKMIGGICPTCYKKRKEEIDGTE